MQQYNVWIEIEALEGDDVDEAYSSELTFAVDGAACYRTDDPEDAVTFANWLQQVAAAEATARTGGRTPRPHDGDGDTAETTLTDTDVPLQLVEGDPIMDHMATLRERFRWQASTLWAKGLPPTADEIADAMMRVVTDESRWRVVEKGIWCRYRKIYVTTTDQSGCGCGVYDPAWPKSDEWMRAHHMKAIVLTEDTSDD